MCYIKEYTRDNGLFQLLHWWLRTGGWNFVCENVKGWVDLWVMECEWVDGLMDERM